MSYSDLLNRMMERDTEAFLEFTDRYGWALYSSIRTKCPNKEEADKLYHDTMTFFYRSLQNTSCGDPVEAILCAFSDKISSDSGKNQTLNTGEVSLLAEDEPPQIHLDTIRPESFPIPVKTKKKGHFWFRLGMTLVLLGIAATIWICAGLLMDMDVIPYYDLGYSWFSELISRLYTYL